MISSCVHGLQLGITCSSIAALHLPSVLPGCDHNTWAKAAHGGNHVYTFTFVCLICIQR